MKNWIISHRYLSIFIFITTYLIFCTFNEFWVWYVFRLPKQLLHFITLFCVTFGSFVITKKIKTLN